MAGRIPCHSCLPRDVLAHLELVFVVRRPTDPNREVPPLVTDSATDVERFAPCLTPGELRGSWMESQPISAALPPSDWSPTNDYSSIADAFVVRGA